jgi:ocular albinism type 1 protein
MIVNPVLYISSTKDMKKVVICSMAQMTSRERKLVHAIRLKFAMTNIVYYVCWIPNLLNGILLWTLWFQLPVQVIIILWYIMVSFIDPALEILLKSLSNHVGKTYHFKK